MAKLIIWRDEIQESPREWDNVGTMYCWHSRYALGDINPKLSPVDWSIEYGSTLALANGELFCDDDCDEAQNLRAWEVIEKYCFYLPLYLYEHGGLAISTSRAYPFNCPWDSGQVGWIIVNKEQATEECNSKEVLQRLVEEVKIYNQYLQGDTWGFGLEDDDGNVIDSCGGFYGRDPKENGIADHLDTDYHYLLDEPEYPN